MSVSVLAEAIPEPVLPRPSAHGAAEKDRALWRRGDARGFLAVAAGWSLGVGAAWGALPPCREWVVREGGLLETVGAYLFFCAFAVGLPPLWRCRRNLWDLCAALPFPLLGLLAFLDEIGYGAGDATPTDASLHIAGYPVDGVHDLLAVFFKLWRDSGGLAVDVAGACALGLLVGWAVIRRGRYMPRVMAEIRRRPPLFHLRTAILLVALAMALDLDVVAHPVALLAEETAETLAALALLFGAACLWSETRGADAAEPAERGAAVPAPTC